MKAEPPAGERVGIVIEVQDNGPGIAEEAMSRLFTPYAQASLETARTYGGTGLGLAVSRQLARLMGGDITVESVMGEGSRFTLRLPVPKNGAEAG